jgi:hypothetical protein
VPTGNLYYIAGSFGNPEIVNVVSDQEVFDCPDLYSTQGEADTRMILQALHADKRLKELGKQGRIIIKTSDTDVTETTFTISGFPNERQCNTDFQGALMGYFD